MRGLWVVLGGIVMLAIAYLGDRWLWTISTNAGTFAGDGGWRELGHLVALLARLLILGSLVAVFLVLRGAARWAGWALVAIGALVGILPALAVGLNFALGQDALPFIQLNETTDPILGGRATLLPWTATALLVLGVVRAAGLRSESRPALGPITLGIGAALAFVATYGLDELFRASAIAVASTLDAYPLYVIAGIGSRLVVMAAFAVLLLAVTGRAPSRLGGAALVGIGLVGFVVLPVVGLMAPPFPPQASESLADALGPGTAGRWMAGAILAAGVVELVRSWSSIGVKATPSPTLAGRHEPA